MNDNQKKDYNQYLDVHDTFSHWLEALESFKEEFWKGFLEENDATY